jgi:LuxR family maltose regulon positive regulatory protein
MCWRNLHFSKIARKYGIIVTVHQRIDTPRKRTMQRRNFFLRTKLLPPRPVTELLERPRLTERLFANLNSPITMVAADAGYGKTTLIADFLRNQPRPSVWYQLDRTDADPFVFLGYIAQGIKNFAPDFGEAIFPYLAEANEELLRFPERVVDLFLNEILQTIEQPFILVLDDYHHIGRETIVHRLVDRILLYSSDMLHIIITTRELPPLAITRRRSQSAALVLTREDLLFTDNEVRELFKKVLNVRLGDKEIAEYHDRTHGWITALQLVRQIAEQEMHIRSEGNSFNLHEILQHSEKDIFNYFAEEVFARESEETQKLLLDLSLLESLPLDVCSRLFPRMRCSAELPELARKNVFLTVAGDVGTTEVYRFHPLFRDFLLRRLRSEIGHEQLTLERNRIAEYFIKNNRWEAAFPFLLDAQNFDRAAAVIADNGGEWISGGAFTSLGMFAERIPTESLERFPRSLLHRAEVARLQGDLESSAGLLSRAVKLLHRDKDGQGEAEALHSLASLERRKGATTESLKLLEKAEKLVKEDSETFLKCANTRGLCFIAEGNWAEAERQFRFALKLAEKQVNERYIRLITHNLALAPGFRGDFGEALRWFKRIFRDDQPDKQLPQEAIGHLNVARLHLYRGEFDETEKHLNRTLELCQLYNLKALRGETFEAYGNFYREKGDLGHAAEFYERAVKAYEAAEISISNRELNEERAKFYLIRNDFVKARSLLENLIEARRKLGGDLGIFTARTCLARVNLKERKTEGLVGELQSILDFFQRQNHYYDEAVTSMLLAEALWVLGNRKDMIAPLQRALDLSARFDYDYWLRCEIRGNSQMFSEEQIAERIPLDLREELENKIPETQPILEREVVVPVTDLTIEVLGHINIFRDPTKPFASDAWTTRRARDIFCYIATSKHRRVGKDVLIDAFWGDGDIAAVEKNFHPTISHIRKALNSRQAFKQNFLVFRDGAYQLNPELTFRIDSEEFEHLIAEAEIAKREKDQKRLRSSLESAYGLYRGEFMSGVFDAWAEVRRNYYKEQFSRVLGALAKQSFSEKSWSKTLKFANEVLHEDPYREDIHRLVMKVYAAQSKPAYVKEQFDTLQKLLKSDLAVEPAMETRRLFQELMQKPAG